MSSTICRKIQITTCDYDRDDNDVGDVGGDTRSGWGTASTLAGPRVPAVDLSWRYLPLPFSLGIFYEKEFSKYCNYPVFLLLDNAIVCCL